MIIEIFKGNVYHKRHFGNKHAFKYPYAAYLVKDFFDLDKFEIKEIKFPTFTNLDFDFTESMLFKEWTKTWSKDSLLQEVSLDILKIPNFFNIKAFNPVCFIFLYSNNKLLSILVDVTNTFKDKQFYKVDIQNNCDSKVKVSKNMYVSPFNKKNGYYLFQLSNAPNRIVIEEYSEENILEVFSSINGRVLQKNLFSRLVGLFVIFFQQVLILPRIHLQALKLYLKKNIVYPHKGNSYHKNNGKK